jgi:hypothetical protein
MAPSTAESRHRLPQPTKLKSRSLAYKTLSPAHFLLMDPLPCPLPVLARLAFFSNLKQVELCIAEPCLDSVPETKAGWLPCYQHIKLSISSSVGPRRKATPSNVQVLSSTSPCFISSSHHLEWFFCTGLLVQLCLTPPAPGRIKGLWPLLTYPVLTS